jgi:restriction system protein
VYDSLVGETGEGGDWLEVKANKVRTPLFPLYSTVRQLLVILEAVPKAAMTAMLNAIRDQTGTPQNPVDWSDPDTWITERLSGEAAELARRVWEESNRTVNPRHIHGAYLFINGYDLLLPDTIGSYRLTERGKAFLGNQTEVVREIDDAEGLPQLLAILATKTRAKRGDLLPEWGEFLREYSNFGTASTIKDTLRRRLVNLVERGMVSREGNVYVIEPTGVDYAAATFGKTEGARRPEVMHAINAYNNDQREALRKQLAVMHPYRFEHLIRELLEAMGYDDVTVTKESGDKGVDVVATVQFGITTITEVVQVKRHQASIGRPVLDQLRGALPYHKAIRGTLITLGSFSKGCTEAALFPGAAPIGLIDGDKLLELLIEHEIGIQKRPATLYELDEGYFEAPGEDGLVQDAITPEEVAK